MNFLLSVMEVACGEYGESVHKLVMAVKNGKCQNYGLELSSSTDKVCVNNNNNTVAVMNPLKTTTTTNGTDIQETSLSTTTKMLPSKADFTAIAIPEATTTASSGNDSKTALMKKGPTCTTSLLDSNESVIALPNSKTGFPTSSWIQIWILLKRTFLTIMRDQQLTHMRLVSHVVVGTIIGMIYYDIGNDASKVRSNAGCIFFTALFTMFTAMMPTILTCK